MLSLMKPLILVKPVFSQLLKWPCKIGNKPTKTQLPTNGL